MESIIAGLHFIQFEHWPLRLLYFVLIATGYIYWLETRRKRHVRLGLLGVRIVEGPTVGSGSSNSIGRGAGQGQGHYEVV
ncbi:MAG: hypothetical protein U5R46_04770 [Gammaproteobacteria bacterium]|nr:hypothetical protein [Gammaproteobacteria bacterium]